MSSDGPGSSPSPDQVRVMSAEDATAERVGCAALACSSAQPLPNPPQSINVGAGAALPPPHSGSSSPFASGVLSPPLGPSPLSGCSAGLPPRIPSNYSSPRASMPSPRTMFSSGSSGSPRPHLSRRQSVEEDGAGEDYPIPDEELAELRKKRTQRNPSYAHIFPKEEWPGFRPIEEHGLIGNMHTCALVSTDAQISWFWSVQKPIARKASADAVVCSHSYIST